MILETAYDLITRGDLEDKKLHLNTGVVSLRIISNVIEKLKAGNSNASLLQRLQESWMKNLNATGCIPAIIDPSVPNTDTQANATGKSIGGNLTDVIPSRSSGMSKHRNKGCQLNVKSASTSRGVQKSIATHIPGSSRVRTRMVPLPTIKQERQDFELSGQKKRNLTDFLRTHRAHSVQSKRRARIQAAQGAQRMPIPAHGTKVLVRIRPGNENTTSDVVQEKPDEDTFEMIPGRISRVTKTYYGLVARQTVRVRLLSGAEYDYPWPTDDVIDEFEASKATQIAGESGVISTSDDTQGRMGADEGDDDMHAGQTDVQAQRVQNAESEAVNDVLRGLLGDDSSDEGFFGDDRDDDDDDYNDDDDNDDDDVVGGLIDFRQEASRRDENVATKESNAGELSSDVAELPPGEANVLSLLQTLDGINGLFEECVSESESKVHDDSQLASGTTRKESDGAILKLVDSATTAAAKTTKSSATDCNVKPIATQYDTAGNRTKIQRTRISDNLDSDPESYFKILKEQVRFVVTPADAPANDTTAQAALTAADDPACPLSEPAATFLAKCRKIQRKGKIWKFYLQNVYVYVPVHSSTPGGGEGVEGVEGGRGRDVFLPECVLQCNARHVHHHEVGGTEK